ncbi:MAG TPA: hypothetical protein VJ954_06560 [Ignavibacteriaceae bacterium]|nr:hypothetical protein [Ignavibacteriaceae bacterium]
MKYLSSLILTFLMFSVSYSQVEVRGSMGVDFVSTPSLYDYINQNFAASNNQVGSFNAAVMFSGEVDYDVSQTYEIGLDLGYRLYSYNTQNTFGTYDLKYHNFMPTLVNYYVINGEGYQFKFGAGAGIRFLSADESLPGTGTTQSYSSTGFGILLRGAGNTRLSNNVYINIGLDARYDFNGEPSNGGKSLYNFASKSNVNFNSLSVGLSLGLTFFL